MVGLRENCSIYMLCGRRGGNMKTKNETISTKKELIKYIKNLSHSDNTKWENVITSSFLEALAA